MKYSVGQKVITHQFHDRRCVLSMRGYDGKVGIITEMSEDNLPYLVHGWWWPEEALELAEEPSSEHDPQPDAAPSPQPIDLTKILRAGDKIYSTMQGDVEVQVATEGDYIICEDSNNIACRYYTNGRYWNLGECLLFPSRDNRDWSTFKRLPDLKKGDIVKVWDDEFGTSSIRVFSHLAPLGEVCTYSYNDSTQNWQHAEKISVDELKDFE